LQELNFLSENLKEKLINSYEKNKELIELKEEYETWRKIKYDKRCYPFRRLVGEIINNK